MTLLNSTLQTNLLLSSCHKVTSGWSLVVV